MTRLVNEFATNATQTVGDQTGQPPRVTASAGFLGNGFAPGYMMPGRMFNDEFASHAAAIRQLQNWIMGGLTDFESYGGVSTPLFAAGEGYLVSYGGLGVQYILPLPSGWSVVDTEASYIPIDAATAWGGSRGPQALLTDGTTIKCLTQLGLFDAISGSIAADKLAVCQVPGSDPVWFALQSDGDLYAATQATDAINSGSGGVVNFSQISGGTIKITGATHLAADGPCVALAKINGSQIDFTISTDMGASFIDVVTTTGFTSPSTISMAIDSVNGKLFLHGAGDNVHTYDLDGTNETSLASPLDASTDIGANVTCLGHGIVAIKYRASSPISTRFVMMTPDGGQRSFFTRINTENGTYSNTYNLQACAGRLWMFNEDDTTYVWRATSRLDGYQP